MTTPDLPPGLPPFPPVPEGSDRWEKCNPESSHCEAAPHWQILRHIAQGLDDQGKPGYASDIRDAADAFEDIVKSTDVEARVCDLERQLAEARTSLANQSTVLRLLKEARDYRMDMAAYERIQKAINILQP